MVYSCSWLSYTYMEGELGNGLEMAEILVRIYLFYNVIRTNSLKRL